MGDAMNIAARLESANKQTGSTILVSEDVRTAAPDFAYRGLGRIAMSGVATGIALHEPLPKVQAQFAEQWNAAIAALKAGSDAEWKALEAAHADDPAAKALDTRIDSIRKGEVHVFRSK